MKFSSLLAAAGVTIASSHFAEAHDVRVDESRGKPGKREHVKHNPKTVERVGDLRVTPMDARSGMPQQKPCTLVESVVEGAGDLKKWYCMVAGEDARSAGLESGNHAMVKIEGIGFVSEAFGGGGLVSGESDMFAEGAWISNFTMRIPQDATITFTPAISSRSIKSSIGQKTVLIARVTTSDGKEPSPSAAVIADKNFGINGDQINTVTVFAGCSHGKMTVVPATGSGVVNGVIEISVDTPATNGNDDAIYSKSLEKLEKHFGVSDLDGVFDFVMIVAPDGVLGGAWAAPNTPYSVYGNDAIIWPTFTVHEMGHNLMMDHSWEGTDPEGDHQGQMGYVEDTNDEEGSKLCFNPAKNWFVGWYTDKAQEVKPQVEEYAGRLRGVANYDTSSSEDRIVIKLAGPSGEQDYYIGYNHKDGWNSATRESINEVTVVKQKPYLELSNKVASLAQGQEYKISNYLNLGSDVTIKVNTIDPSPDTGYADIQICFGACGGSPPAPTSPTPPSPTPPTGSPPTGGCTNLAGWTDSFGDDCSYYENNEGSCDEYRTDQGTDGKTPVDACCTCDGGSIGSSTGGTGSGTGGGCTDLAGWTDSFGTDCSYYKETEGACETCKDDVGTDGKTPVEACCVCKE